MFYKKGGDAVHPAMTRTAQHCQSMKTPQARLQAIKRHLKAKQRAKPIPHEKNAG
jgi:hypothetical protein